MPDKKISRRKALKTVGVAGLAGLSGCQGDGDNGGGNGNGGGELGERVPTITIGYWGDLGGTTTVTEGALSVIRDNMENNLGVSVEAAPMPYAASRDMMSSDRRPYDFFIWSHGNVEFLLDPHLLTNRYRIDWAGNQGSENAGQFASCEYTEPAIAQASATSTEERKKIVHDAMAVMNDERFFNCFALRTEFGLGRSDLVNWDRYGDYGFSGYNYHPFIHSTPTDQNESNQIIAGLSPDALQTTNYFLMPSMSGYTWAAKMVHSPLVVYDENYQHRTELAESYSIEDDATTITFNILEDATFHGGEPVTAEDVKFTFEYVQKYIARASQLFPAPYESIEAVDDKTVVFNMTKPFIPLVQDISTRIGIMHKASWEELGAPDELVEPAPEDLNGSGPYEISNFTAGEEVTLTPTDDHVLYDVDHDVIFASVAEQTSGYQSLVDGAIHFLARLSPGIYQRGLDEHPDIIEGHPTKAFEPYAIMPCYPKAPAKFRALRDAVAKVMNRAAIVQVAFNGNSEPIYPSHNHIGPHPYAPSHDKVPPATTNPQGDPEAAKASLEEAGFGWDNNGNLRYPPDADLAPLWPEQEAPDPSDYPCLDENGELSFD